MRMIEKHKVDFDSNRCSLWPRKREDSFQGGNGKEAQYQQQNWSVSKIQTGHASSQRHLNFTTTRIHKIQTGGNDTCYDLILDGAPTSTSRVLVLFWRNTNLWCEHPFWRKEGLVMPPFRSRQPSFKCISVRGREVNGKASKSPISPIHSAQEGVDLSPHRSCTWQKATAIAGDRNVWLLSQ